MYKQPKDAAAKQHRAARVKALVDKHRKVLPRLGTRKLHHLMGEELRSKGLKIGRDGLFALLGSHDLLIKPRRRYVQTTNSRHWLRKWPNLVKEAAAKRPDEVWVSDITYLKTQEGTMYLNMVTDAYSRRIVGYAVADNMETASMIKAFEMAIAQRKQCDQPLIHHSDRGVQYCSKDYVSMAAANRIVLSMSENGDPYENALAERMNRTIKEEFSMDRTLKSKQQTCALVEESILLYNSKRPHLALKMKTPDQVHKTKIPAT
ncbi:Transposase InsO and inactivated derivatives [Cnuella takakiae]|uniref:Transposase InsO and inactivated derivatives n=1 Tax=Cnuella takakiae TaxID=1302690 RepID=A0A1M5JEN9_9BACT|nr:IS3 family transposase [Cnuella takakiae]SHG38503.1 Transposase InsO and inactivated derivatives [Cnuella takakiae]